MPLSAAELVWQGGGAVQWKTQFIKNFHRVKVELGLLCLDLTVYPLPAHVLSTDIAKNSLFKALWSSSTADSSTPNFAMQLHLLGCYFPRGFCYFSTMDSSSRGHYHGNQYRGKLVLFQFLFHIIHSLLPQCKSSWKLMQLRRELERRVSLSLSSS